MLHRTARFLSARLALGLEGVNGGLMIAAVVEHRFGGFLAAGSPAAEQSPAAEDSCLAMPFWFDF